jgi:hypothetical protein
VIPFLPEPDWPVTIVHLNSFESINPFHGAASLWLKRPHIPFCFSRSEHSRRLWQWKPGHKTTSITLECVIAQHNPLEPLLMLGHQLLDRTDPLFDLLPSPWKLILSFNWTVVSPDLYRKLFGLPRSLLQLCPPKTTSYAFCT